MPGYELTTEKAHVANSDTMVFLLLGPVTQDAGADVKDAECECTTSRGPRGPESGKSPTVRGNPKASFRWANGLRRETTEVSTMWTLLALNSYGTTDGIDPEVRKRADAFLAAAQPGKSTEWFVLRQLLQPDSESWRADLLEQQHPDGGWGWLTADPSDAFGTGEALYALACSGLPANADPIQKAIAFLRASQQPDGSWQVPSTRASDKNKVIPTSTYWGTAWAVIGLLESQGHEARGAVVK